MIRKKRGEKSSLFLDVFRQQIEATSLLIIIMYLTSKIWKFNVEQFDWKEGCLVSVPGSNENPLFISPASVKKD